MNRLVLLPLAPTASLDAFYAWARPGDHDGEYVISQTTAYDRPVPPVRLPATAQEAGVLQAGKADIELFDASAMHEGTSWSSVNAFYLQLTYVPIRGASIQGTVSVESGTPVLVEGTLKGTVHRADLEHAVWLARAHCNESGHGSGTCEDLDDYQSGWLRDLFWWNSIPEMADADTAPFCAHITGRQVTVTGIDAP